MVNYNHEKKESLFLKSFPFTISEEQDLAVFTSRKIINLKKIISYSFDINSDLSLWEDFALFYCWSYDGKSFNNWKTLKDFQGAEFSGDNNVWIKVAIKRLWDPSCPKPDILSPIQVLDFNFNLQLDFFDEVSPRHTFDGFKNHNQNNRFIQKNTKNLYNIYEVGTFFDIYEQMSNVVHDFVGINVEYVKTFPDDNSVDHFFKEYSINREFEAKEFKIVVPDNQFHSQTPQFNPFSIDFADVPWEVHIVKKRFEETFGVNARPIEGDFLYIPLVNKLYRINAVVLDKSFLEATGSFYKISLVKYENQSRVVKKEETLSEIDDFTFNMADNFKLELNNIKEVQKPMEHDVLMGNNNWVWEKLSPKVEISDEGIEKYYTIISKNYYNFKNLAFNEEAILWKNYPEIKNEVTYTFWFNIDNISEIYPLFSLTEEDKNCRGFSLKKGDGVYFKIEKDKISFIQNKNDTFESYDLNQNLEKNKWYALVVNINNSFNELSMFLWGDNNERNTKLTLYNKEVFNLPNKIYYEKEDLPLWRALGGNYKLTNLKILNKNLPEENQSLFLTQYIVKNSQHLVFVDSARKVLDVDYQPVDKSQMNRIRNDFK